MEFPESGSLHTVKAMRPQHEKKLWVFPTVLSYSLESESNNTVNLAVPLQKKALPLFSAGQEKQGFHEWLPQSSLHFQPAVKEQI